MSVQAKLGVVGKVGAELQEERAEVSVHDIDVEVVHHSCGAYQPGIGHPGLFVPPPLGAEHRSFFLRFADQHDTFLTATALPVFLGDVVLAFPFPEGDHGNLFLSRKSLQRADEGLADGLHQDAGGKRVSAMKSEEAGHPAFPLQLRDVHVQVHPVNAFYLQRHMLPQNLGYAPW